jgi:hypothetical protein
MLAQIQHRSRWPKLNHLLLHRRSRSGPDGRIEIDASVKVLAPIRNPANRAQRFDVLEVWGHIYTGDYRMRLIHARLPDECVLMGQEALEYASL